MAGIREGTRRAAVAAASIAVAVAAAGCVFSNKVQPLAGEDPKALEVSGERQDWLDRTGATRAAEALHKALRSRDGGAALALLGPRTRAIVAGLARRDGREPADLVAKGRIDGLGLPGLPDPLGALATGSPSSCREADPFDPARRSARVRVRIDGVGEFVLPAVFTESGWQVELVGTDGPASGAAPPAAAASDPS